MTGLGKCWHAPLCAALPQPAHQPDGGDTLGGEISSFVQAACLVMCGEQGSEENYNQEAGEGQLCDHAIISSCCSQDDISVALRSHNGLGMVSGKKSNYDQCL